MGTIKKRHLIAGTIIGGLLLAATTQTGNSFALSDTPSAGDSSTTTSQQTPQTNTAPSTTTGTTPTDTSTTPKTDSNTVAGGSTATQTGNTAAGVTSGQTTGTNPSNTTPTTVTGTSSQQPTASQTSTGPSSDPTNNALTNTTTDNNKIKSKANTGDATVEHTSTGGNATTGDASAIANLINSIASSTSLSGNIPTATYNVNGTQNGDIVINPEDILAAMNNGSVPTPPNCAPGTNTSVNNNATINNLLNLLAQSGDAKVTDNGIGGNATSGNATTEADIVNMIQDLVSNKGAFLGVVNINGNLNGNIDLPASDINALLTPTQRSGIAANTSATNNANVNNNVTLTAISGNAAVTNNGQLGSATSGNAKTILNENNLINCQIAGGNLLLVFVNVMGHWYGALLGEPAGTTTATLGGGITQDTLLPTSQTTATNNSTINNNVNLTSISGNATVANNGVGGNAKTGNATAIADISNIIGSQINLSGWLGILIINVFGTWNGSLGTQPTSSSTAPVSNSNGPSHQHGALLTGSNHHNTPGDGYSYYIVNPPQSFDDSQFELASAHLANAAQAQLPGNSGSVLGSSIRPAAITTNHNTAQSGKHLVADFILAGIGAALALTGGLTRLFVRRPQK